MYNFKKYLFLMLGVFSVFFTCTAYSEDVPSVIKKQNISNTIQIKKEKALAPKTNPQNIKKIHSSYLGLSASAISNSTIRVSWNGNNSKIKWKKDNGGSWNGPFPVEENPAGVTANNIWYYDIPNLQCDTKHQIKVKWQGRGWRKTYVTTNGCGAIPCPHGGWFDSKNCQIGKAPAGTTAFIYSGNYYYTSISSNQCPYQGSWYDGANCFVQAVPSGVVPFIYANHWYYKAYP